MRLSRSVTGSLVVALVSLAVLQLDARRVRRDFERSVVARHPFGDAVPVVLPDSGPFRLVLQGNASADGVPELVESTDLYVEGADAPLARFAGNWGARAVRLSAGHRLTVAVIERIPPGSYVARIVSKPPLGGVSATADYAPSLLLVRGKRPTMRNPVVVLAVTTLLVVALGMATIGIARAALATA